MHNEMKGADWTTNRQKALLEELSSQLGAIKTELLEETKRAIRTDAAEEFRALAEKERARLHKEEK